MIEITIYQNKENQCIGFRSEGHAEYDETGQDIVCSAVSVLIINTINSIELFTEDLITVHSTETGYIECHITEEPSKETSLLVDSMILGLTSIEDDENYSDFIDIIYEEV